VGAETGTVWSPAAFDIDFAYAASDILVTRRVPSQSLSCLRHAPMESCGLPMAAFVTMLRLSVAYGVRSAFAGVLEQREADPAIPKTPFARVTIRQEKSCVTTLVGFARTAENCNLFSSSPDLIGFSAPARRFLELFSQKTFLRTKKRESVRVWAQSN
jgi:hypothetical protein